MGIATGLTAWTIGLPNPAVWGLLAVPLMRAVQGVFQQILRRRPVHKFIARKESYNACLDLSWPKVYLYVN
jgi:hypothetical protein